jgi:hypothetical protein
MREGVLYILEVRECRLVTVRLLMRHGLVCYCGLQTEYQITGRRLGATFDRTWV